MMCLAACSGEGGSSTNVPAPTVSTNPMVSPSMQPTSSPTAGPASTTKTPIHGLLSMGSLSFTHQGGLPDNGMEEINAHPGVYSGAVINVTWAQLEQTQGNFDDSAIDSALSTIAAYNAKYPATPVVAKLRIDAGANVPAWVMQVAGGPIGVTGKYGTIEIAAFWTTAYDVAWQALQAHLASVYDRSAAIAEVAISSCSSQTDEPFVIALDSASLAAMRPFGFSDATLMACLTNATSDYAAWKNTPLDFTFNQFRLSDGPSLVPDPAFTTLVMQEFRSAIGLRGVIANHGLQSPLASGAQPVYDEIATLGPPIEFQAYSPLVDWPSTFALGLTYHPTEFEIWQTIAAGGQANLSQAQLAQFASQLP